jgi:hypothetical protein
MFSARADPMIEEDVVREEEEELEAGEELGEEDALVNPEPDAGGRTMTVPSPQSEG